MPRKESAIDHLGSAQAEVKPAQTNRDLELQLTRNYMNQEALRKAAMRPGPQPAAELPTRIPMLERANRPASIPVVKADELIERAKERSGSRKKIIEQAEDTDLDTQNAAALLVRKFRSLSTEWNAKLEALRAERHLTDVQMCLSLMAYALDSGNHMNIPMDHPYFSEKFEPTGTRFVCVICDEEDERKYPGQPPVHIVSEHNCSAKFNALKPEEKQALLEAAAA